MDSLLGITHKTWLKLLWENRFAIDPVYWHKAAFLTVRSIFNSYLAMKEKKNYHHKLKYFKIEKPPIFIIGHWRSGTTLLHNIFIQNKQFAYPNLLQVSNPHTFLTIEKKLTKHLKRLPEEKRPMDNIGVKFDSPGEDEFALNVASLRSPIMGWTFPRRELNYDQYLTFQGVPETEIDKWRAALLLFIKKLTLRYNRQLVLKSPVHTGRIKILYKMFPDAKFINIHRNPYTVFRSTQKLVRTAVALSYLQHPIDHLIDEGIIRRYVMMYSSFFSERELIPKDQFIDVAFEDLEKDMVGTIQKIYTRLNIEGFSEFEPSLEKYVQSISGYRKNKYKPLPENDQKRISYAWYRSFVEWGYEI